MKIIKYRSIKIAGRLFLLLFVLFSCTFVQKQMISAAYTSRTGSAQRINHWNSSSYQVTASYSSKTGEVTVNYSGAVPKNKDWIGIYQSRVTPSNASANASLAWKYVTQSKGTIKFVPKDFIDAESSPQKGSTLEQGKYKAVIFQGNGYRKAKEDGFTVDGADPELMFEVYSDSHIMAGDSARVSHLEAALKDIKCFAPGSNAIVSNGDAVDQADSRLYNTLRAAYVKNKRYLPMVYFNLGNHELFDNSHTGDHTSTTFTTKFNRFLYYTKSIHYWMKRKTLASDNRTKPYYEEQVGKYHFIFLASQTQNDKDNMHLKNDQLNWLYKRLYNISSANKKQLIFVFGHGALKNTVAGSYDYQGWSGVLQDAQLKKILNYFPNVVYISGHSHWKLDSANTVFEGKLTNGDSTGAIFANDASISRLWSDENVEIKNGCQGIHVMVYKDKIVFKGRDYSSRRWLKDARYTINLEQHYKSLAESLKKIPKR